MGARWVEWRDSTKPNSLRGMYVGCSWRDQYYIHFASHLLLRRLAGTRIQNRYEEFDDDHSDIDYRMDVSLPFLYWAFR